VGFLSYCRSRRGFSPIFITAALSIATLLAVAGFEIERVINQKNITTSYAAVAPAVSSSSTSDAPSPTIAATAPATTTIVYATTSPEGYTPIGSAIFDSVVSSYATLQSQGMYSANAGQTIGQNMAANIKPSISYKTFAPSDIHTDSDTSYTRMLRYRADLQTSLAPLMKNKQAEYEIFGLYVQTGDASYLAQLKTAAQNYRDTAEATTKVIAPIDAVSYQVAMQNAMEEFASTLDAMADNATDPIASVALLRTYDQAEADVLTSFNAFVTYEKQKKP
jgi:hypothetical protein